MYTPPAFPAISSLGRLFDWIPALPARDGVRACPQGTVMEQGTHDELLSTAHRCLGEHAHQDACTSSSEEEEEEGEEEGEEGEGEEQEKGEGERLDAAMLSASTNPYKAEPYKSKEPDDDGAEGSGGVTAAKTEGATATKKKKKKPRPPTSYRRLWNAATGGDTKGALVGVSPPPYGCGWRPWDRNNVESYGNLSQFV
eukprot:COSAG01_NODE_9032_length_2576_cov_6.898668_1_plen_198_part_00